MYDHDYTHIIPTTLRVSLLDGDSWIVSESKVFHTPYMRSLDFRLNRVYVCARTGCIWARWEYLDEVPHKPWRPIPRTAQGQFPVNTVEVAGSLLVEPHDLFTAPRQLLERELHLHADYRERNPRPIRTGRPHQFIPDTTETSITDKQTVVMSYYGIVTPFN